MTTTELATTATLADCEAFLERNVERKLKADLENGGVLRYIRDNRRYQEAGYTSFETYCEERWDCGRNYANKLIAAYEVGTTVPSITSERQARELADLAGDPEKIKAIAERAEANGRITAKSLKAARLEIENPEQSRPNRPALDPLDPAKVEKVDGEFVGCLAGDNAWDGLEQALLRVEEQSYPLSKARRKRIDRSLKKIPELAEEDTTCSSPHMRKI